MAIVGACRELIRSGAAVTMPDVAGLALVSEATAYRYFPDLASLVNEAFAGMWPDPARPSPGRGLRRSRGRVAFACDYLLRGVLAYQGSVRAVIAHRSPRRRGGRRPGMRFGLIDEALAPLNGTWAPRPAGHPAQADLAAVVSAEAFFTLTDLARLAPATRSPASSGPRRPSRRRPCAQIRTPRSGRWPLTRDTYRYSFGKKEIQLSERSWYHHPSLSSTAPAPLLTHRYPNLLL